MKLEKYLEETGLKRKFFCEKIGITPATLCNIIAEDYPPKLEIAIAIEHFTEGKVSVYDWLTPIEAYNPATIKHRNSNQKKKD
jgi:DNA-binding XRE family transcriptional regulator